MKYLLSTVLVLGSISAFSQQRIKVSSLKPGKDTVYVGINNKLLLPTPEKVLSVKSDKAAVKIINDTLIVSPRIPGKINIDILYKDSIHSKRLVAVYLPDPGKNVQPY